MKNFILSIIFLAFTGIYNSQTETLVVSDYIESYDWLGGWYFNNPTTGYYSNLSVSPGASVAIFGTGDNTREQDWYSLSNVTVDGSKEHIFRMRLAAQSLSGPTESTAGLDGADYVDVQISKNNSAFNSELRVTGFSNATWDFSSTAVASKTVDGSITTFQPAGGGDRTLLGDGYSYLELIIPAGPTTIAIDVYCRLNRAGEDWWLDNFELYEVTQSALPVELSSFEGQTLDGYNLITWTTESENNSDYFSLESSFDGEEWKQINLQGAAVNSTSTTNYHYSDDNFRKLTYYRLKQYDIDGQNETFGPISVVRHGILRTVHKTVNLLGQDVDENYKGIVVIIYQDGSLEKRYNK